MEWLSWVWVLILYEERKMLNKKWHASEIYYTKGVCIIGEVY